MTAETFAISVSGNSSTGDLTIKGELRPSETTVQAKEPRRVTRQQLDTVRVLEQWLGRWEWIAELGRPETADQRARELLVPDTFTVLGTLLWQLILDNEVGQRLIALRADKRTYPLRVLLGIDPELKELACLPWEFLHPPDSGAFLAIEANLVLGRLQNVEWPDDAAHGRNRLRVVLWLTLPDGKEFEPDREKCLATLERMRAELGDIADVPPAIQGWRPDEVLEQLGGDADILHIVGVCRQIDDKLKILLQRSPTEEWRDCADLVKILVRDPGRRPELVVLHLCDWPDGDTTANFERLAPELIRNRIPRVLAMQYPMEPGDADHFLSQFYVILNKIGDVGHAVQSARWKTFITGKGLRSLGTPVLYLPKGENQLLKRDAHPEPSHGAGTTQQLNGTVTAPGPRMVAGGTAPNSVRDMLLDFVELYAPEQATAEESTEWIMSVEWPDDPKQAWLLVQSRAREMQDDPRLGALYARLTRYVREVT